MRVEQQLDTVLIRLHGEFDLTCEEPFREELAGALDANTTTLVLDLRALTFIDSCGLRMLVTLDRRPARTDWTSRCSPARGRLGRFSGTPASTACYPSLAHPA
jgi:anti-anti-sigma factor